MMRSDIKGPSPACWVITVSLPSVRILPAVSTFAITSSVTAPAGAAHRYFPAIGLRYGLGIIANWVSSCRGAPPEHLSLGNTPERWETRQGAASAL